MSILSNMTDEEIKQWKEKYNGFLIRHCKAMVYLDNLKVAQSEREKWISKYQEILKELDYIVSLFDKEGIKYTNDQAMGGFKL